VSTCSSSSSSSSSSSNKSSGGGVSVDRKYNLHGLFKDTDKRRKNAYTCLSHSAHSYTAKRLQER
jgi:hypothetical protein